MTKSTPSLRRRTLLCLAAAVLSAGVQAEVQWPTRPVTLIVPFPAGGGTDAGLGSSSAHIKGGRVRALMVAGDRRVDGFAQIPSAAELGLPGYDVTTWYGLWAPRGTPADVQAKIIDHMSSALASEELKAIWASNGSEVPALRGPAYRDFVLAEFRRWAEVLEASGAMLE